MEVSLALNEKDYMFVHSDPKLIALARRLQDLSDENARRIFTTHPTKFNMDTQMNDEVYSQLALHALGVHGKADAPKVCKCGKQFTPAHPHGCVKVRRKAVTARHNGLYMTLGRICQDAGYIATFEPKTHPEDDPSNKRPDILVVSAADDEKSFSIDTSVIHTTSASYLKTMVSDQLQTRANTKTKLYQAREGALGREFIPFIVTSFGTFHADAINLLDRIAVHARARNLTPCIDAFKKNAIRRLLYTLHLGNFAVLEYAWSQRFG